MGPYLRVDLLVLARDGANLMYSMPAGGVFCKTSVDHTSITDTTHEFLLVPSSEEEEIMIHKTCEACVTSKIKYNLRDVMLSSLPFRDPQEKTLFQASQLYCAQSIVLILRECLNPDNVMARCLQTFHSRTVTASTLYHYTVPHCTPVTFKALIPVPPPVIIDSTGSHQPDVSASTTSASPIHTADKLKAPKTVFPQKSIFPETWDKW